MAIHFVCPYGHRLKVPDHRAGKKGRCPKCQQRVIVPVPNPIPSGREKRHWDASPGERIEIDDQITPASSQDALLDNPYLGGLIGEVETPRPEPSAEPAPESEQPSGQVISELEWPPEIATFAIDVPAPAEPPLPNVPSPPIVPPLDLNADFVDADDSSLDLPNGFPELTDNSLSLWERAGVRASDEAVLPHPHPLPEGEGIFFRHPASSRIGNKSPSMEGQPPSPGGAASQLAIASPPLPPAPTSVEPPASGVQIVHAPPPVPPMPSAPSTAASRPTPRPRWVARASGELVGQSYRASPQQSETAYWLAAVLLFVIVFTSAPALGHLQLDAAPRWAQAMLLVAGLQLAYAAWLAIVPDWSTVSVGAWMFAASAVLYAAACGWFGMAGGARTALEYAGQRGSAAGWCGVSAVVLALMSYACGQVGGNWRRADSIAFSASRRSPQT